MIAIVDAPDPPAVPKFRFLFFSRLDFDWAFGKVIFMAYFATIFRSIMQLDRKIPYKPC